MSLLASDVVKWLLWSVIESLFMSLWAEYVIGSLFMSLWAKYVIGSLSMSYPYVMDFIKKMPRLMSLFSSNVIK